MVERGRLLREELCKASGPRARASVWRAERLVRLARESAQRAGIISASWRVGAASARASAGEGVGSAGEGIGTAGGKVGATREGVSAARWHRLRVRARRCSERQRESISILNKHFIEKISNFLCY